MKLSIYIVIMKFSMISLIFLSSCTSDQQQQLSEEVATVQGQEESNQYDEGYEGNSNQYEQGNNYSEGDDEYSEGEDDEYSQGNNYSEGNDLQGNEYGNSVDENFDDQSFGDNNYSGNNNYSNNENNFFGQNQNYNDTGSQYGNQIGNSFSQGGNQYGNSNAATSLTPSASAVMGSGPRSNLDEFRRHFSSFLAGHPEGVFYVVALRGSVHLGPNRKFEIVGYLNKGDYVHAISIKDEWAKIGRSQYVSMEDIRNAGLKTRGIEIYYKSLEEIMPEGFEAAQDDAGYGNNADNSSQNQDANEQYQDDNLFNQNNNNYNQNNNNSNFNQNNNDFNQNNDPNFNQNYNNSNSNQNSQNYNQNNNNSNFNQNYEDSNDNQSEEYGNENYEEDY